jgi:uncharacterized protein YraI
MKHLALLILIATATTAQAAEAYRVSGIGRRGFLHLREQPDGDAEVVTEIPWNARGLRGFGCTNETPSGYTWCRIKYGASVGWARRRYLQPEPE